MTQFNILADLNNNVFWMGSIRPLISPPSSTLFKLLQIVPSAPITKLSLSLSWSTAFFVLWQNPSICQSFRFLWFSPCGSLRRQSPQCSKFIPFFFLLLITQSDLLDGIRWSVCISNYHYFTLCEFFAPALTVGFSVDSKVTASVLRSPGLSSVSEPFSTMLWSRWFRSLPHIFNSSSPLSTLSGIVPSALTTIGITVTLVSHSI